MYHKHNVNKIKYYSNIQINKNNYHNIRIKKYRVTHYEKYNKYYF